MKLITSWNPKVAPYINNPEGASPYRMVALVKDGVFTFYICFFDQWTGKIYIERAEMLHVSKFYYRDCVQIENDKEWSDILLYLRSDECKVIQSVETTIDKDDEGSEIEGKLVFHKSLSKLPLLPYGINMTGTNVLNNSTSINMTISPSIIA